MPDSDQQQLYFDPRFLEHHTGRVLLNDPVSAVVELVANAWDAGAWRVNIDWPLSSNEVLRVRDNGQGMTEEQFQRRWLTLSYDRTKEQESMVKIAGRADLSERQVFGRNG